MTLLERVRDRRVVASHDGRSGARLERGHLDDGTPVYVKIADHDRDVTALVTGTGRRELDLWESGVLSRLPAGAASALLAVEDHDGAVVTISRDVGDAMFTWERVLTPAEVRAVFGAMARVHECFAGRPPDGLCPLEVRVSLFAPHRLDVLAVASPDLAAAVRRGWEVFDAVVPADVAGAVARLLEDPAPLVAALDAGARTLLHGDFWFVNLAVEDGVLVLLDWGLATAGPPALDFVTFCAGAMSNVALPRTELLAAARHACGRFGDPGVFAAAELWALLELGWNKALDAVDHPDRDKRDRERADLDFWVARGRAALDAGLPA